MYLVSSIERADLKRWWFERRQITIDIPCEHEGAAVVLCQAVSSAAARIGIGSCEKMILGRTYLHCVISGSRRADTTKQRRTMMALRDVQRNQTVLFKINLDLVCPLVALKNFDLPIN